MPGKPPCAPLAGAAAYARAAPHNRAGPGAIFDRAACEAHLAATYGGNPETLKNRRTKGGPRSLPWGIIHRTLGRTERIFPLRLILEISK